jgi:hypothetical protein
VAAAGFHAMTACPRARRTKEFFLYLLAPGRTYKNDGVERSYMISNKWRYLAALLAILSAASAMAQDDQDKKIAVLPFGVSSGGENPTLDRILFEAVTADGRFTPLAIYSRTTTPDLPPEKSQSAGLKYAITAQAYPDEDTGKVHAQIWIWDTETGGLVITDEMVYYDLDEAENTMNALTAFLISRIPEEEAPPPPAITPPQPAPPPASIPSQPAPPPVLVRNEERETPAEEKPSQPPEPGPDFFASVAWAPFFSVYGREGAEFDQSFNMTGGILTLGFMPFHSRIGSFGLELGVTYNFLGKNPGWAMEKGSLLNTGLSFIYRTAGIKNFLFVKITLSGGVAMMFEKFTIYSGGPWSPASQDFVPNAAAGLSLVMRFGSRFFIELGGAFTIYFPKDFPDRGLGLISPRIGFGRHVN